MSSINHEPPVDLTDLLWGAWRQKWLGLLIFAVLSVICIGILFALPDKYVSRAQLLVRLGPNSGAVDPTISPDKIVSIQESRLHQVNSVVELLSSRAMLERVATRVGPEKILHPVGAIDEAVAIANTIVPQDLPDDDMGYTEDQVRELILLGNACERLSKGYKVSVGKNAYTINLAYNSGSPYLSNQVIKAVLAEYPEYHANAHESTGSVPYFEREAASALKAAQKFENNIRDTKIKYGIVDLESSQAAMREKLTDLERNVNLVDGDLAEVDASIVQMQTDLKSIPDQIQSEELSGIYKQSGDLVRQQLYALELREKEMATNLNSDHPKMLALRTQLDEGRRIAKAEIGTQPQIRRVINPNYQAMDLALRSALAKKAGLVAKKATLEKQFESAKSELQHLAKVGSELTQLEWDSEVSETMYKETAARLANARQVSGLESLKLSDVTIAQAATLQLTRTGPWRVLIGPACLLLNALIATICAVTRDLRKTRVEARKANQQLGRIDPAQTQCAPAQPSMNGAAKPDTATALPGVTQPGVTQPGVTQPSATQPGATQPGVVLPGTAETEVANSPRGTDTLARSAPR